MLVKPSIVISDITAIDLDALWQEGIRGFIFDLDNTIMAPRAGFLEDRIKDWLKAVQGKGFKCIVVSNNPRAFYIEKVQGVLEFPIIGNAGKPRRRFLRKALELLEMSPEQVTIVGDRPLTDIWGGNRLGSHTILVDPLIKATESPLIKFLRKLEHMFVIK